MKIKTGAAAEQGAAPAYLRWSRASTTVDSPDTVIMDFEHPRSGTRETGRTTAELRRRRLTQADTRGCHG